MARLAWAVLLLVAACGRSAEEAERERVVAAIDAVRDAPIRDVPLRRTRLEALRLRPASAPAVASARDVCAAAYAHLFNADDIEVEVRRAVESGEEDRPDLPRRLEEAEADIARARAEMPACEAAVAGLRPRR